MPVICWGPLGKTAQDPTTIADYIAAEILDHNVSSSAHGLDGYAVYNHRVGDVLDHADGSVLLEKLTATKRIILSAFESMDGWESFGTISQELANLGIWTAIAVDSYAGAYVMPGNWVPVDWSKDMFWQSTVKLSHITSQIVYFGIGGTDNVGGESAFGFKVDDGNLYCYHAEMNGGALVYTTFQITGITLTDWNVYRAIYDQSAGTLKFYVNGVLKKTFNSGLPTADSEVMGVYEVKAKIASRRYMYASDFIYSIDR